MYYFSKNEFATKTDMLERTLYEAIPNESISNRWTTGLIPIKNGDIVRINAIGYHTTSGIPFCFIWTE
jgi:hypothetical protein